jgi:hypothetical protein
MVAILTPAGFAGIGIAAISSAFRGDRPRSEAEPFNSVLNLFD